MAQRQAGFTLIEILMVLTIFALSLAIAGPSVSSGLKGYRMKASARTVAAAFNHARSKAQGSGAIYYAEVAENKVALTSGGGKGTFKEINMPSEVKIKTDGASVIAFYPAGGSSGGEIKLSDTDDKDFYRLVVDTSTGMVKIAAL